MFKRLEGTVTRQVTVHIDDRPVSVPADLTVAAAMLARDAVPFRASPVSGAPRAPYCMIGVCFDCLVEIDGKPNRQACLVPVRDGMRIRRQAS
jgi:predicted molibdopterin-dependent oxidoreductase YjgC